jgi:hypothetical protein
MNLHIDFDIFPLLKKIKHDDLNVLLLDIFKMGYDIYFPSNNIQNIEYAKLVSIMNNNKEDLGSKLLTLESSLSKLIGISNNSNKKGAFGENMLEDIFNKRYGDITFEKTNHIPHSGDAILTISDYMKVMLEIKNYQTTVNKDEVTKLEYDMVYNNIRWGLMVSFNSSIQGMKDLDLYTFANNNNNYFVIMISNLSLDINKLDLGISIIKKLFKLFDNKYFPWIVSDINDNIKNINKISQKNFILRDNFYYMEKEIINQLSKYHVILRDYQYELETEINNIMKKILNTIDKSTNNIKINDIINIITEKYKDHKMYNIIIKLFDIITKNNLIIDINDINNNNITINNLQNNNLQSSLQSNNNNLYNIKIQQKKIIITTNNDMIINLNINKDKENNTHLDFINNYK